MEDLAKLCGLQPRPDHELESMVADHQHRYRQRFMVEVASLDERDRDRFLYYARGEAWVCTDFVQSFEGVDGGTVRVLNGRFLMSTEGSITETSIEKFHKERCVQHGDRWFVDLPKLE